MPIVSPTAETLYSPEANASGVSWPAVFGGAFVTASMWVTLTILGVGLGLYAISPWAGQGASAKAISMGAIVWLIVTQIIAAGLGGYIAGRLRTKWAAIHTNEVYFRDTAHGFLVWAVAVVVSAAFLSIFLAAIATDTRMSAVSPATYYGQVTPSAPGPVPPASAVTPGSMPGTYSSTPGTSGPSTPGTSGSSSLELMPNPGTGMSTTGGTGTNPMNPSPTTTPGMTTPGGIKPAPGSPGTAAGGAGADPPAPDSGRITVSPYRKPGATPGEITLTPQELDKTRKDAARTCLWIFVALFIGAFCASFSATFGGRQRDAVELVEIDTEMRTTGVNRPYDAPVV